MGSCGIHITYTMYVAVVRFRELLVSEHDKYSLGVVSAMTNNPNFTNPGHRVSDLEDAVGDLQSAEKTVKNLERALESARLAVENNRRLLNTNLQTLVRYVNDVAKGNLDMIKSSGFAVGRKGQPPHEMVQTQYLRVVDGKKRGQVKLRWNKVPGAQQYKIEYTRTPGDAASWTYLDSGRSLTRVADMIRIDGDGVDRGIDQASPAIVYYFRVAARGPLGFGDWSEVVSHTVVR